MAFTIKLSNTHDLFINSRGKFTYVYGEDEVRQRVLIALRHYWQEYFLDVDDGIPWNESILGSRNLNIVELILRNAILRVPGVVSILQIHLYFSEEVSRQLNVNVIVQAQRYEGSIDAANVEIDLVAVPNEFADQHAPFAQTNWMFANP